MLRHRAERSLVSQPWLRVYPLPSFLAKDLCPLDLAESITYANLNGINRLWRKMSRQRTKQISAVNLQFSCFGLASIVHCELVILCNEGGTSDRFLSPMRSSAFGIDLELVNESKKSDANLS